MPWIDQDIQAREKHKGLDRWPHSCVAGGRLCRDLETSTETHKGIAASQPGKEQVFGKAGARSLVRVLSRSLLSSSHTCAKRLLAPGDLVDMGLTDLGSEKRLLISSIWCSAGAEF